MKIFENFSILCAVIYVCSSKFSECATSTRGAEPKPKNDEGICTVPNASTDRNYSIVCSSTSPCLVTSNTVTSHTILNINCQPGYLPTDKFQKISMCLPNGTWSPAAVACQKACEIKAPSNTNITCTLDERQVSCSKYLNIGTKITSRCKSWFKENESSSSKEITCEKNAQWSGALSGCTPICGSPYKGAKSGIIVDGKKFVYGEAPWHVAIYRKINIKFGGGITLLSCIGTIITPFLILSDARCFYNEITQANIADPRDFEAVVSKVSRNYDVVDNGQTKSYRIRSILYSEYSVSGSDTIDRKLALLEVENEILLSPVVLPVCLSWDKSSANPSVFSEGTPFKLTDWIYHRIGHTYELELETTTLSGISRDTCISKVSEQLSNESRDQWLTVFSRKDKFCVNNTKPGSNEGGGLIFQSVSNSLYYLIGIIEHNVKDLPKLSITSAINVLYYIHWIKQITNEVNSRRHELIEMKELPVDERKTQEIPVVIEQMTAKPPPQFTANRGSANKCQLPDTNKYNFQYELVCPDEYSEAECDNFTRNSIAPRYSTIKLNCLNGYTFDVNQEPQSDCIRNSWRPALRPCKKICRKLKPRNVDLKCTYQNSTVDCDGDLRSGTRVLAECIREYRPEYALNYVEIRCDADGEWNAELLRCVPNCGKPTAETIRGTIHGGKNATFGEFPWHVAVYDKTRQSPFDLICGATILTEFVIISAAHCFYDREKGMIRDSGDFEMVVGKITRNRSIPDSEITKTYTVKRIIVNNFHGILLRYQNDIAIIEMDTKIIFNPFVIPSCLYYSKNSLIPIGNHLKVAGWGRNEKGEPSALLKITELPVMGVSECISKAPPELVEYFSSDKFCVANSTGDSSLDSGDSGGGLFYQDTFNSLYYLSGIVSFKSLLNSSFIGITNVNYYTDWISTVRNEIHDSRSES